MRPRPRRPRLAPSGCRPSALVRRVPWVAGRPDEAAHLGTRDEPALLIRQVRSFRLLTDNGPCSLQGNGGSTTISLQRTMVISWDRLVVEGRGNGHDRAALLPRPRDSAHGSPQPPTTGSSQGLTDVLGRKSAVMQHFPCQERALPPEQPQPPHLAGQGAGPAADLEADGLIGRPLDATGRKGPQIQS